MKIVSVIITVSVLIMSYIVPSGAIQSVDGNVFVYDSAEVYIDKTKLDYDTQKRIADKLAYGVVEDGITVSNILCLFGHDIETVTATVMRHNKYTTSPKCEKEYYDVETCTRCDHSKQTLAKTVAVYGCHD